MLAGDLIVEIDRESRRLEELLRSLREDGIAFADARCAYQVAKATKELELREDKMAATIIQDIALGDRAVAKARRDKDVAEAMYNATREAINVSKLKTRLLNEQYSREWASVNSVTGRL